MIPERPSPPLLVHGISQLITLRATSPGCRSGPALSELALIEDAALLIRDGVITQIGSARRIENLKQVRGAARLDLEGSVVLPPFVDPALALAPVGPAPAFRRLSYSSFADAALALLRSCFIHGTLRAHASVTIPNEPPAANFSALRRVASLGSRPIPLVRAWRAHLSSQPDDLDETLATLIDRKLAHRFEVSPETPLEIRERLWNAALALSLPLNLIWNPGAPTELSDTLSRLAPRMVHCAHPVTPGECEVLAASSTPVVLSPARGLAAGPSSFAVRLVEQGAAIALSSGYDEYDLPVFNMQSAISLAVLQYGLTIEQAIAAAIFNSAHAAGLSSVAGTLEAGKRADLLVLDLSDYRELARRFGSNHVAMILRDGRIVFNRTPRKVSAP